MPKAQQICLLIKQRPAGIRVRQGKRVDQKAQVLMTVYLGAGHTQWRPDYHCSGPAAWLGVNEAGPTASVRTETSGERAQRSRVELFPQVGEAGTDKGEAGFPRGQTARSKFQAEVQGKPGSKAGSQKTKITVTGVSVMRMEPGARKALNLSHNDQIL